METKLALLTLLLNACAYDPGGEMLRPDAAVMGPQADASPCNPNATACITTCGDILTDPNNCGACSHSCNGAACSNGLCDPTVLAQGQAWPIDLAVTPDDVYWINEGGAVMRLGKSDLRSAPTVLASEAGQPASLALDQTSAYWLDAKSADAPGALRQMPLDGGPIATLEDGLANPAHLAEAAGHLFWTDRGADGAPGAVMKRSLSGAAPMVLVPGVFANLIAVNRTTVYYTVDGVVQFVPIVGGSVGAVRTLPEGTIRGLGLSPTHVYWATQKGLRRAALGDVNTQAIYGGKLFALTIDARSAYFAQIDGVNGGPTTFSIRKLPLDGGHAMTLAVDQAEPRALAVDDAFVYWVNYKGGTVMRVAK